MSYVPPLIRGNPANGAPDNEFGTRANFVTVLLMALVLVAAVSAVTPLWAFTPLRSLINPGMYVSQIPHSLRLGFRLEMVDTDPPKIPRSNGHFEY